MSSQQKVIIEPRSEWRTMSLSQLYDLKIKLQNRYFDMRLINASFADQFNTYVREVEGIISLREIEAYEQQSSQEDS